MPPVTLWRISNSSWITADSMVDAHSLALGLRAHLLGDGLCSAVVQIGPGQRSYLALHGCEGCAHSRCLPGCRVVLMRRTLRATMGADAQLTMVRRGLDPLGYQRFLWAWPSKKDAQLLSSDRQFQVDPDGAYAEAWALTFFLAETEPRKYIAYLGQTAAKQPFTEVKGPERLKDFTGIFGEQLDLLEAKMLRFVGELK